MIGMRSTKGRRVAIATGAIAVVVIALVAFIGRDWIAEEWWIYRLRSRDDETRIQAATKIAERKCLRGVSSLILIIQDDKREVARKSHGFWDTESGEGGEADALQLTPITYALFRFGPAALPQTNAAWIESQDPRLTTILSELRKAWTSPDPFVWDASY
jgi:hypothetical protein